MKIRQYRSSDRDTVWNLHNLALEVAGAHAGNGAWDDDFDQIDEVYLLSGGEFLVGEVDGRLIAMGALKRTDAERVEMKRIRIHPSQQRKGYGQMIIHALQERAIALGYRLIHLDTTTIQIAAQKLFEKNGFIRVGKDRFGKFELLLYEKELPTNRRRQSREAGASQDA